MRHGIRGAGVLVLALTIVSWIGDSAPADDVAPVPAPGAVVLELAGRRAAPTSTLPSVATPADLPDLPDHLVEPTASDAPEPATIAPPTSSNAPAFVSELNALRVARELAPFTRRVDLDALAQGWAAQMAAENDLRHSDLIYDVIGGSWTTAGENIGYGPSVTVIFDALEASPGHLDNMVNPDFTSVGVGVVRVGDVLWTAHLFAG